jgi:acyl carrier protein
MILFGITEIDVEEKGKTEKPESINISPRNEIEQKVAGIWSRILGIEEESIDVKADFFQLGGNSLKALLMIPEISLDFGVNLLIIDIYELTTIEKIAKLLEQELKKEGGQ